MAPFKLKFRMGSSRSTSQEHDPDPQVNEALLNHHANAIGASNSTIDSADCNSLGALSTTNERKSLLPNKTNILRLGYINHNIAQCINEATTTVDTVPTTPPPSYEHVLEENTRLANSFDLVHQRQLTTDSNSQQSRHSSRQSININSMEQLSLNEVPCTDPDCQQNVNYVNNEKQRLQQQNQQQQRDTDDCRNCDNDTAPDDNDYSHKESIDSTELLISMNMADIPQRAEHHHGNENQQQQMQQQEECQLEQCYDENCTGAYGGDENDESSTHGNANFNDTLMNQNNYYSGDSHYQENAHNHGMAADYGNGRTDSESEDCCETQHMLANQHQHEQQQSQYEQRIQHERAITPEIISNKSSKEIYKDLAKQWGITCKMSDGCRCMECQSHYFDCEFDDNEHQKTDGGLGAGTPMFISEVMHGSACNIL